MASVTTNNYYVSPTMRFVDDEGRLTKNGFDLIKAAAQIVSAITIEDGEITEAKIADGSITTAKIDDAAITSAKIDDAAITNAKIGNLEVDNAKIANLTIATGKYGSNSIISASVATNTSDFNLGSSESLGCSVNLTTAGGKTAVIAFMGYNASSDRHAWIVIKKNGVAVLAESMATVLAGKRGENVLVYLDTSPGSTTNTYSVYGFGEGGDLTHVFSSVIAENHKNA